MRDEISHVGWVFLSVLCIDEMKLFGSQVRLSPQSSQEGFQVIELANAHHQSLPEYAIKIGAKQVDFSQIAGSDNV
ncbi:MAG: hypothetical protein R3A44_41800 [Caldilineaceae bacterium]